LEGEGAEAIAESAELADPAESELSPDISPDLASEEKRNVS
jgi:hypothetical protein